MEELSLQEDIKKVVSRLTTECMLDNNLTHNKIVLLAALTRNLKGCLSAFDEFRRNERDNAP